MLVVVSGDGCGWCWWMGGGGLRWFGWLLNVPAAHSVCVRDGSAQTIGRTETLPRKNHDSHSMFTPGGGQMCRGWWTDV